MTALREEFHHEALFYAGQDEFVRRVASFVREGLADDEPILAVLSAPKIEMLRAELRAEGDRVEFADMSEVGRNPARIIPAWRDFIDRNQESGPLRGVGEPISPEREQAELVECQRHESLLNLAFADACGFRLICPYDTTALAPEALDEARRSHPFVSCGGVAQKSPRYRGLDSIAAPCADPLPDPPPQAESCTFDESGLPAVRQLVCGRAADAGFSAEMTEDLVLAVAEIAANSVIHGGGTGTFRIWRDGPAIVCEVSDRGLIDRPLAGRERPAPGQPAGYGLWLANQVCDLVQVRTFAGGSTVRLHMRRARRAAPA